MTERKWKRKERLQKKKKYPKTLLCDTSSYFFKGKIPLMPLFLAKSFDTTNIMN